MSETITIYEKSTCTKCIETKKILEDAGVDFKTVFYYESPLGDKKIKDLLRKLKMTPRDLVRKREEAYKKYDIGTKEYSDDALIKLMAENPDLIQRPIIEKGERAVLGRPPENVREIL